MLPNQDKLTNSIHSLPYEQVAGEEHTDAGGLYPKSRLISPISAVVVRQDDPSGPKYQEALGYTFLINLVKFPGLARMDDGRLVLTLSRLRGLGRQDGYGLREDVSKREEVILYSNDEGKSWSQPQPVTMQRVKPINLGGNRLMLRDGGHSFCLSHDSGKTWGEPEPGPKLLDGHPFCTDLPYTPLVEGNTVTFIGSIDIEGEEMLFSGEKVFCQGVLWRYHLDNKKWDEPYLFPEDWALCEGSLTRARNGDLVAAFRTQMVGVPIESDHWMGLATLKSSNNGKTWSEPAHHFLYGHHHCGLIVLPDGRILMTYASRIGELEGRTYHGVEAVLSHDNGATWDWEHRCILFRWPDQVTHSPQSVCLSDGRILTVFLHGFTYSWTETGEDQSQNLGSLGNVSVVIWRI